MNEVSWQQCEALFADYQQLCGRYRAAQVDTDAAYAVVDSCLDAEQTLCNAAKRAGQAWDAAYATYTTAHPM